MNELISPKYLMRLVAAVETALLSEFKTNEDVKYYIENWHETDYQNWQNFNIYLIGNGIDIYRTLQGIDGETLMKIAIDLGVETPDFIPSIPTFRNKIKADYKTAYATFEKAFKKVEDHPDEAISMANSALESIIKEILKDDRLNNKLNPNKTLYDQASHILKEFQLFPNSEMPQEIKIIGNSLLSASQGIERLRSEKTHVHGKTADDYVIHDSLYAYFIINSLSTVGLFLMSYYKSKFPKPVQKQAPITENELPF